jgi:copper chaperone NosL
MIVASLVLIGVYLFPMWSISLEAPQYPEGLGLKIWINQIGGQNKGDLAKVNNLNHYIGMKEIIPESIPELKVMPYLIGFMIIFGLVAAFTKKKFLLYSWVIVFVILMIVGLIDYYMWGYDYGHNLNPEAAIQIPGMTYQPPLIGSKKLLNFTATSLPDIAGWIIFASITMGVAVSFVEFKKSRIKEKVLA